MTCPICGEKTKVLDSRPDVDSIRRKRECLCCKYHFYTTEIDEDLYEKYALKKEVVDDG